MCSESAYGTWYEAVCEETLPVPYRLRTFSDILKWFEKNHPECLENDCALLRKKQKDAVAKTKRENAERHVRQAEEYEKQRQQARITEEERLRIEREKELAEKHARSLHFAFVWGYNKKYNRGQWQAERDGVRYVLSFGYEYNVSEGSVPVEMARHLVPGKIILVNRI